MSNVNVTVFVVTFLSYGLYHSARKTLSGVKASVTNDWLDNSTHLPLFSSNAEAETFLGTLDAAFMIAYAGGLFFWGWLGDRLNPKHVVVTGMIGSAIVLTLFGSVPKWCNFYNISYYMVTYIVFGFIQACGWPSEITIMANWFDKGNRGFIMGIWASCQPVGNVFGSFFIAWILPFGYEYTFFLNALLMLLGGAVVMTSIDSEPRVLAEIESEEAHSERPPPEHRDPISIINAILLPGVLALVNYAFFFWLPLYLTQTYHWKESEADEISAFYDIGGIIGSVAGGYVSDKIGCRSPVVVIMLFSSIGSLFLYVHTGSYMIFNAIFMTIVGITVSGPYNLIVSTISMDLGSQPDLASNEQAMSTVTGLLDGTGSIGSAIGQLFVPIVRRTYGWTSVFYLFMILNTLATLSILKRCVEDLRKLSTLSSELAPLLDEPVQDE